ncbi:Gfo/Idh/MocA family oxidoreductase [Loktanella sp. SALINAS62]|uniref:Gfo/Idh/MocA family protein n=1 Tax=Loktanella sp. SALINAS62 TaxID=2706124 RepID=UPI001B8BC107|nr:Gfo/Idh/MocA family oxidoreductase [Loktanella sp. SALINAS62]MBS1304264.1 Gfo/Idh/MocA family oxidoreductase [Loktanella sp. SALINAS62]
MSVKLNYGIVGCGMMAREHIQNIALLDDARVAVVYDPVPALAAAAAELAGGARVANTLDDLLAEPALDAVVVVSPNDCHVDQLRRITAARDVAVLCEKPLFTDPADCDAVLTIAARHPAPIWVAMEYRYMPPVAAFLAQAQDATGGIKMLTIREHRFPFLPKIDNWNRFNARSGGTLVEKCCHFFDLMRVILQSDPVRVMASAGQDVNHLGENYAGAVPDIWDNAYVIVDFASGARAMLELCMFAEGARYQEEITATGPKGRIEVQVPGPGRFWPPALGPAPTAQLTVSPRSPKGPVMLEIPVDPVLLDAGDHNGSTFYQHQRFAAAVRGQGAVEVTAKDGTWAVMMGQAAQESASTGQAVTLVPPAQMGE